MSNQSRLVKEFTLCDDNGSFYIINEYETPVVVNGDTIDSKIIYDKKFKTSDNKEIFYDDGDGKYYFIDDIEQNYPLTECT